MTRAIFFFLSGLCVGVALLLAGFAPSLPFAIRATTASAPVDQPSLPAMSGIGALGRVEPNGFIRNVGPPGMMAMNRVDRILVHEGDVVAKGQLLAEFADAPLKDAAVREAEATVALAQADLTRVKAAGRPTDIAAQKERIASLDAQTDIATRDAERAATLVPSGAGPAAAADRAAAVAKRFQAERLEAIAQLLSMENARPEDVVLATRRVEQAQAALARTKADAALSRIYAPIAGQILKIYAHVGDMVGNTGLLAIADLSHLDVMADVYQTDVPRIRIGDRADIIIPGSPQRYGATVRQIGWLVQRRVEAGTDPIAAVDARTVQVTLALDRDAVADLEHRVGMQVQVAIAGSDRVDVR